MTPKNPSQKRLPTRRGSVYVAVLGTAMLVTLIGLSALAATRMQRAAATANIDMIKARAYAESAVELGLLTINTDSTWRTDFSSGTWATNQTIGDGTYALSVVDTDGSLSNRPTDAVTVTGTGSRGQASQMVQVSLQASGPPLDSLAMAVHCPGGLNIAGGNTLTVSGAPASTNGTLFDSGTVNGDAQCLAATVPGNVTGTLTIIASSKANPDSGVFAMYKALATTISPGTIIDKVALGPGNNPWGASNSDGVYYWNGGGSNLTLRRTRIYGTLVVDCPGKTLTIDKVVLLQAARSDYPCLIVNGDLSLSFDSSSTLDESVAGNLNPVGMPYSGVTDSDSSDSYPAELQGLVHVRGAVTITANTTIRGVLLAESSSVGAAIQVTASPTIIYTPSLYTSPPMGYMKSVTMSIVPGTWKQIVN